MNVTDDPSIVISVEPLQLDQPQTSLPAQRDGDLVLAYWLEKTRAVTAGDRDPFLDFTAIETEEWRHRFLMIVDEDEGSVLLLWGFRVAQLLEIPAGLSAHVSISRGITDRYRAIFRHGCAAMLERKAPIRVEAQFPHTEGQRELVRACFMPIIAGKANATRLALGTINRRVFTC
jgi:hypothetical protein